MCGDGLWVTTDGGEHWSASGYPGGAVVSLEIIDRQVLTVTARHGAGGLTGWTLWRRAVGGGPWVRSRRRLRAGGLTWQAITF